MYKRQRPNSTLLNDWKDKKGFAIWIDGKVIDNTEISNYNIVHYAGGFVYKNARSKRFPQSYQMHLYTAAGFEGLKKEIASPLPDGAVIHLKKGKHSKKVGATTKKVSAKEALAEANALPVNYVNENNGPNEIELPSEEKTPQKITRKDIVIVIDKNGVFIVNHRLKSDLKGVDKNIKTSLGKILHKKSRSSLIIYHTDYKQFVAKVTSILKENKIYDIETINMANLPPPPPPPAPKKPRVIEVKVKDHKVPAPKKPSVVEVVEMEVKPPKPPTKKEGEAIGRMHQNIKGQKVMNMTINGQKHYYIIKNGVKYIYNEKSQLVDENGNVIPPPPPKKVKDAPKVAKVSEEKRKAGYLDINGETYYYNIMENGYKQVYNRYGQPVDKNGKVLPPPPPKKKGETGKASKQGKRTGLVGVKHVPDENQKTITFPTINAGNIVAHVKVMNRHNACLLYTSPSPRD